MLSFGEVVAIIQCTVIGSRRYNVDLISLLTNTLSKRSMYPPNINIKPDLNPEERICESKLLVE